MNNTWWKPKLSILAKIHYDLEIMWNQQCKAYMKSNLKYTSNIIFQLAGQIKYLRTPTGLILRGMVKNLPLLRSAGNNGRPWVHAIMCDNTYSDICMIIHALTL